jgi:hypothetical protein
MTSLAFSLKNLKYFFVPTKTKKEERNENQVLLLLFYVCGGGVEGWSGENANYFRAGLLLNFSHFIEFKEECFFKTKIISMSQMFKINQGYRMEAAYQNMFT